LIYDVSHLTRYQYDAPVAVNVCVLRLLPRSEDGQRVLEANVEVTPRPLTLAERADAFGNRVLKLRIETPHRELTLLSRARVVVERQRFAFDRFGASDELCDRLSGAPHP